MIRDLFTKDFGEEQAAALIAAAEQHANETNSANKGADPFKWAILICIGFECVSRQPFREHHGITVPWEELKRWFKEKAELETHTGDFDYLAAFIGVYDDFLPVKEKL